MHHEPQGSFLGHAHTPLEPGVRRVSGATECSLQKNISMGSKKKQNLSPSQTLEPAPYHPFARA